MLKYRVLPVLLILLFTGLNSLSATAKDRSATQDLIDGIVQDVVDRTINTARSEVERVTRVDPMKTGVSRKGKHRSAPSGTSDEQRRELGKLKDEHDRKIAKLEAELEKKLKKAGDEFEREAAKEDKEEKIEEKRKKLEEKVDAAYEKYEKKVAEENERFDDKREKILSKS